MNIYCVKGVAAYHEFACAMRAVQCTHSTRKFMICYHTLHTVHVYGLQVVLQVILARNMSAA
jgi:hypothetical protein